MTLPLLVLRPEPGASATAARVRALGLEAVVVPLFELRPVGWKMPEGEFDALLLTSANAVRAIASCQERVGGLPVVAVGPATAKAARDAGLEIAEVGSSDATTVASRTRYRHLLHLCAYEHTALNQPKVTSVAVYAAEELPAPDLPPRGVALLHSPRAARRFAELVDPGDFAIVAISDAVRAAAGAGWRAALAAATPTDAAMLSLARGLCERGG